MKARMEQLINGRFEYEVPGLLLSQEKLTFSVTPEEKFKESCVRQKIEEGIKGMAYSSHRRLLLDGRKIFRRTSRTALRGRRQGLKSGDKIEGEIVLSTSIGEYRVPFSIEVKTPEVRTSQGAVRTLEDFVKLAKEDFREAYQLFVEPFFYKASGRTGGSSSQLSGYGQDPCALSESGRVSDKR